MPVKYTLKNGKDGSSYVTCTFPLLEIEIKGWTGGAWEQIIRMAREKSQENEWLRTTFDYVLEVIISYVSG